MIPLPVNPVVVILLPLEGTSPIQVATNVAADLTVRVARDKEEFDELSKGKPFVGQIGDGISHEEPDYTGNTFDERPA